MSIQAYVPVRSGDTRGGPSLFESVLRQLQVGVAVASAPTGRITLTNDKLGRWLGCPKGTIEEVAEQLVRACRHRDGGNYAYSELPWARALRVGEVVSAEQIWMARRDGELLIATVNASPVRDRDGQIVAAVATFEDGAEALAESDRRIAAMLESVSDAFCALDREFRFTFMNAEAERLMEKRRSDLIGRRLLEVYPDLDGSPIARLLQRAMSEHVRVEIEDQFSPKPTWFEIRAYPSEAGLSVNFRDVTERRRAQLALRVLAETGKQLTDSLDYEATLDQVAHLAVPDFAELCYAVVLDDSQPIRHAVAHVDLAIEASILDMARRHPPRLDRDVGIAHVIKTGEVDLVPEVTDELLEAIAHDPSHLAQLRGLHLTSGLTVPMRARGRILGAIAFYSSHPIGRHTAQDIPLAEEIGRRAGLAVDNARLFRESQSAVRAREDMVAIAAHDLRGPISAMKLRTQLLLRSVRGVPANQPAPGLQDGLQRIERQAEQLAQLVSYFLDVSKIASKQLELQLEDVDLVALTREAASRFHEQIQESGCMLEISAGPTAVGHWDRRRLEQVVNNLLDNALKFGRGKPIHVSVSIDKRDAVWRVTDHGVGICQEEQRSIFERFLRASSATGHVGSGLGLYIVRRIAEALGGSIGVAAAPGAGATFTLRLPLAGPES